MYRDWEWEWLFFETGKSQVFGGMEERISLVKGSAKVVLYAIVRYMQCGNRCCSMELHVLVPNTLPLTVILLCW